MSAAVASATMPPAGTMASSAPATTRCVVRNKLWPPPPFPPRGAELLRFPPEGAILASASASVITATGSALAHDGPIEVERGRAYRYHSRRLPNGLYWPLPSNSATGQ